MKVAKSPVVMVLEVEPGAVRVDAPPMPAWVPPQSPVLAPAVSTDGLD